jgi:hypothetical protein
MVAGQHQAEVVTIHKHFSLACSTRVNVCGSQARRKVGRGKSGS